MSKGKWVLEFRNILGAWISPKYFKSKEKAWVYYRKWKKQTLNWFVFGVRVRKIK